VAEGVDVAREDLRLSPNQRLNVDPDAGSATSGRADLRLERSGGELVIRPLNGAHVKVALVLPVAVHRMKSRLAQFVSNKPEDNVGPEGLRELFNVRGQDRSVNRIWAPAGIVFVLYRVEDCEYSLVDFAADQAEADRASRATEEVMPSPVDDCQARFRWINGAYNSSVVRGVDVYVWWKLDRSSGYGAPHLQAQMASGLGAVWIDGCAGVPCGHLLAHELGHFLGLCHTCASPLLSACRSGRCDDATLTACSDPPTDGLLMRADNPRTDEAGSPLVRFTVGEVRTARRYALQRILTP
jgi:hypothetical protein